MYRIEPLEDFLKNNWSLFTSAPHNPILKDQWDKTASALTSRVVADDSYRRLPVVQVKHYLHDVLEVGNPLLYFVRIEVITVPGFDLTNYNFAVVHMPDILFPRYRNAAVRMTELPVFFIHRYNGASTHAYNPFLLFNEFTEPHFAEGLCTRWIGRFNASEGVVDSPMAFAEDSWEAIGIYKGNGSLGGPENPSLPAFLTAPNQVFLLENIILSTQDIIELLHLLKVYGEGNHLSSKKCSVMKKRHRKGELS